MAHRSHRPHGRCGCVGGACYCCCCWRASHSSAGGDDHRSLHARMGAGERVSWWAGGDGGCSAGCSSAMHANTKQNVNPQIKPFCIMSQWHLLHARNKDCTMLSELRASALAPSRHSWPHAPQAAALLAILTRAYD